MYVSSETSGATTLERAAGATTFTLRFPAPSCSYTAAVTHNHVADCTDTMIIVTVQTADGERTFTFGGKQSSH